MNAIASPPRHSARRRACILLAGAFLLAALPASAQEFGRLFFSVDDRIQLDQRREDPQEPVVTVKRGEPKPEAPAVGEVTFNGHVQRSDGETTIWVNGRPVLPGNSTPEGISARPTGRGGGETRFELPSGAGFELKVGQKIKVVSGKVVESYETSAPEDAPAGFSGLPEITAPPAPGTQESVPGQLPGSFPGTVPPPPAPGAGAVVRP
ncbi:MAG: hypothetical protein R3286_11410 [Gammaproteobacteria bacterium]|nr:hypothetical protein [Gammaproteobacteria bacterium]